MTKIFCEKCNKKKSHQVHPILSSVSYRGLRLGVSREILVCNTCKEKTLGPIDKDQLKKTYWNAVGCILNNTN